MEIHVSVDVGVGGEVLAAEWTAEHLTSVVQGRGLTDLISIDWRVHNGKSAEKTMIQVVQVLQYTTSLNRLQYIFKSEKVMIQVGIDYSTSLTEY